MYARLVKSSLKPNHTAEYTKIFDETVIPILRKAKGFQDAFSLKGTTGTEMVSISLWDAKENAEAYNSTTYPEVLKSMVHVLEGTPHVHTYEVSSSTVSKFAPHTTV
jgi:heme-degrading monooxygenase HmoA